MRYHHFIYIFLLIAILACSGSNLPKGILPRKKMIPILVDIHLAEAINNQKYNISMMRDSLPEDLYLSICKKYKIDRSVIESSLLYYGKHAREYLPIYNGVLDVLSEMEAKAKNDTARPVRIGRSDADTSKTKKSSPPA
ncbi:MAG: DUF4296 domain-containing protein [Bacteroidetes bacterium]|nr:DUF4296 domain-containing protein [Bacteroidota bacterium]